jgi:hypothetical protein
MLPQLLTAILSNPLGLATIAAPFVMDHITSERAKLAAGMQHRVAELQQANAIASAVGNTMDNLAYLSKQAMYGNVFRKLSTPEDQAMWKAYQEALMKWESTKATTIAQMEMYFGADNAAALKKIQKDFDTLASQIEAAFYKRTTSKWFIEDKEGTKNDFRKKYFPVWDRLMAEMTELSKEMIRQIQYEEVGSLREGNNLAQS